jgi:hypothetical protein
MVKILVSIITCLASVTMLFVGLWVSDVNGDSDLKEVYEKYNTDQQKNNTTQQKILDVINELKTDVALNTSSAKSIHSSLGEKIGDINKKIDKTSDKLEKHIEKE